MSELENQLATDLGGDSTITEQQSGTFEAQDTQTRAEDVNHDQETDDIDVASEIDARKEASRQATLQGQIKAYQSKIDSGKIEIDQVPKYLQSYIKHEDKSEPEVDDVETLVEKKLEERLARQKDDQIYKENLQSVKESSLSKDDKARLIQKWEYYKSRGFLDGEALSEAMEVIGIARPTQQKGNVKGASLPKTSPSRTKDVFRFSDLMRLSQKEYEQMRQREMKGEIRIIED